MEIIIIVLGIILDRVTKLWAIERLSIGEDIVVIKDFFSFSYLENRGAAFGIFKDKQLFLISITMVAILLMMFYLFINKTNPKILKISLSLIISGAIGNLIDRIKYRYVVDFIFFHYKDKYHFPIFNIADVLVSLGTILLIIFIIKEDGYEDRRIFS
ncbi:signal peptidase II [Clostridium tetani]|uniref:signal peptidase II n=1 Tax=Clostridium tetani TaxID=1513 RepID=UPI00100AE592|nr:signal peptidase II [Clostridium tetani]RXM71484.1 signal peptidase II [Clostridium tetani]